MRTRGLPSLQRELVIAFVLLFTAALLVAVSGIAFIGTSVESPLWMGLYIGALIAVDLVVIGLFARHVVRTRLRAPLERMIDGTERIARGEYAERLPPAGTMELARLSGAVNSMAERLIAHREQLADNVRSLEATNRELTETRDELIQAEKMSSVGRLAAGIAHEVGNPLGAILGYLGVIRRAVDPSRTDLVAAAEAEVRRIDRIVRGLLDYARPREARTELVDVNRVVRQTMELLSTQGRFREVELDVGLEEALPSVVADPYQLQQVLVNLLLNAVDALGETAGPELAVRTRSVRFEPAVRIPPRRRDDPPDVDYSHRRRFHRTPRLPRENPFRAGDAVVEITVADNGPGIPDAMLSEVFEPFVTTKEPGQGTGLGLAVAARLIDGMGGSIRAETGADGGAAFTVLVPVTRHEVPDASDGDDATDGDGSGTHGATGMEGDADPAAEGAGSAETNEARRAAEAVARAVAGGDAQTAPDRSAEERDE